MIKVAFASSDQKNVDLHFGAASNLIIYDISPGYAELVSIGRFAEVNMKGENRFKSLSHTNESQIIDLHMSPEEIERLTHKPPEDKVIAKLDYLQGCAAVYAASIGTSSIKRLIMAGLQPIIVGTGQTVEELLNEVSLALHCGGLSWVEKAKRQAEAAHIQPTYPSQSAQGVSLITSIDDWD